MQFGFIWLRIETRTDSFEYGNELSHPTTCGEIHMYVLMNYWFI